MRGLTLYEGPSRLGKEDIVVLVTGLFGSQNVKTGDCYQVYILLKNIHPHEARITGLDESICGGCGLRPLLMNPDGKCYVPGYMLNQPWTAWKENPQLYPHGSLQDLPLYKPVRVGAYGDMAAVPHPFPFWYSQLQGHRHLAYTSQWRGVNLQAVAMASVQSPTEQVEASSRGYRTYRRYRGVLELLTKEIECPHPKVQCRECLLCDGAQADDPRKHIVVLDAKEKRAHATSQRPSRT